MIHLDTNFLIAISERSLRETELLKDCVRQRRPISTSTIAWAEFLCGPVRDIGLLEAVLVPPVAFEAEDASKAAALFNATGRRARSLADCMVAAVAIRVKAALATTNKDFRRFEEFGLRIAE